MNLAKNTVFILIALFIDGLQAAISWGIAAIAAFPVTSGGTAFGCIAGDAVAGQIGCWAAGGVLGLLSITPLGLAANAFVAQATIPVGIAIGIAVNICLSIVLGWGFLVTLMLFFGLKPYRRLWWSGAEIIPGINNVPCWTFFTFSCIWAQTKSNAGRRGVLGLASLALNPVRGIMSTKEDTGRLLGTTEGTVAQPRSARELVRESEQVVPQEPQSRASLQDIRLPTLARERQPYAQAI
ncbi:MAG: hypothetical protein Q8P58_00705 [Candidatus Adlerbacteria bacterium]|nr:hypothetical protein [Candidatus Adlerbacteria bacterium]